MGFFGFGKKKAFSQPASSWVDDDDGESLSVYDAALIWMSNGKDEDIPLDILKKNWKMP